MKTKNINFEEITLRCEPSYRGGGIEIDLSDFGKKYKDQKMTAYQNYLGGGMLGSIQNDCTLNGWQDDDKLQNVAEQLKKYFHSLTNPNTEWEGMDYEQRQNMPSSAY